jgi:hypothetical protein
MDTKPATTRREFISSAAAAAAAFTIVPRHVLGGPRFVAPSDKINVAVIGAGGQGRTNARALMQEDDCQIIAVADPAASWDMSKWYYGGLAGRLPVKAEIEKHYAGRTPNFTCADYEDFRVMLEKEKAIDAVLIATPDHNHAYVSILAMKAGKHVYCEKPLTHTIKEARLVAKVAKETGVATQMGNQGRSGEGHRRPSRRRPRWSIPRPSSAWTSARTTSRRRRHAAPSRSSGTTTACVRRCRSAWTPTMRSSAWARARTACSSSGRRATSPAAAGRACRGCCRSSCT